MHIVPPEPPMNDAFKHMPSSPAWQWWLVLLLIGVGIGAGLLFGSLLLPLLPLGVLTLWAIRDERHRQHLPQAPLQADINDPFDDGNNRIH